MKKCKHIWKARISSALVCDTLEHSEANFGKPQTSLIKICTICGDVKIEIYNNKLTAVDFFNTAVGEMLERYQESLNEFDNFLSEEDEAKSE